jgi:hypothetical protein
MTPMQSLRYLQGFALGDGWVHYKYDRFKLHVYDEGLAAKARMMEEQIKSELGLHGSEWHGADSRTGTKVWIFEVGGRSVTLGLNLGLLKSPEGLYLLAGLWDADGSWSPPDESHPMGQARFFGGWHTVWTVKHSMKKLWGFSTGRMYVATPEGHVSKIANHKIVTRVNVYGTGVLARSINDWVRTVGAKMLLKGRRLSS